MLRLALISFLTFATVLTAQQKVDRTDTFQRVIAVVPMVGGGTPADPRRPKYAPWPPSASRKGIVAFSFQASDDGKNAIVEFVAASRDVLAPILNDKQVTAFVKGKAKAADIQAAVQKYKSGFVVSTLGTPQPTASVGAQQ